MENFDKMKYLYRNARRKKSEKVVADAKKGREKKNDGSADPGKDV